MRAWSEYIGKPFPPVSSGKKCKIQSWNCYGRQRRGEYRKCALRSAPVDRRPGLYTACAADLEEYGPDLRPRTLKVKKYPVPVRRTAALDNLKKGVPAELQQVIRMPSTGAAIRSDGFGWAGRPACRSWPARRMAWRDARLSHRRNGIYGEMLLAAARVQLAVSDPLDARAGRRGGGSGVPALPGPSRRWSIAARCAATAIRTGWWMNGSRECMPFTPTTTCVGRLAYELAEGDLVSGTVPDCCDGP